MSPMAAMVGGRFGDKCSISLLFCPRTLTKTQKKTVLKACGTNYAIASGVIAKQMADGDFKKPIGFATIGFLGLQSVACFARAFRKDDEDEK